MFNCICNLCYRDDASFYFSNALYLLVFVSQRLMFAFESGGALSYLDETLKKALLHIRRIFDKFIVSTYMKSFCFKMI